MTDRRWPRVQEVAQVVASSRRARVNGQPNVVLPVANPLCNGTAGIRRQYPRMGSRGRITFDA
jgi:hypothetical protein